MDPMIWILILVAAVSLIAVFALRSRNQTVAEEEDDQENEEPDEEFNEESEEAAEDLDEEQDEDEDESLEEVPLTSETAKVTALRVEQRPPGLYSNPRDQLKFIADFKVFKGKKKSYSRTIEIPEELYETLKIGESATLITQGELFFDFGDRYAEPTEN